ncbi:unnamed protein product [Peniophora sp. CBMAI 1063]|nr:unnamed protein product [Peniophora sp. CBMAI 1063]
MAAATRDASPISRLTDDDLSIIFLYFPVPVLPSETMSGVQDLAPYEQNSDKDDKTWLHISHVCRRWRSVSLSCLLIWSNINMDPSRYDLAVASLERAKGAPLTTIIDWTMKRSGQLEVLRDLTSKALWELSHTRHLIFRGKILESAPQRVKTPNGSKIH